MQRLKLSLILICLPFVSKEVNAEMPRVELTARFYKINAEVAANQENRTKGLMFRENLADNHGMVFVFPRAERHCMWMHNTLIPLSVAFLDDQGKILNIEDMQPQTDASHCAVAPARFALEMHVGWFAKRGIEPSQKIGGINRLPVPQ